MVGHVIIHNKITEWRFRKYVQFGKRVVINELLFNLHMYKLLLKAAQPLSGDDRFSQYPIVYSQSTV